MSDTIEIELIRSGKFHMAGREVEVTDQQLDEMVEEFEASAAADRRGIDFDHKAMQGETKMGAWIKSLSKVGNRIIGQVELTGAGRKELEDKNYRFVSAEYATKWRDKETGQWISKAKMRGATFTNRPVIEDLRPVALSEEGERVFQFEPIFLHDLGSGRKMSDVPTHVPVITTQTTSSPLTTGWAGPLAGQHFGLVPLTTTPKRESETMPDTLRDVLKLSDTATDDEVVAAVKVLQDKSAPKVDETKYVALSDHEDVVKLLSETTKQVAELQTALHERERDAWIETIIDQGRAVPAEKEALVKLYDLDVDSTKALIAARKPHTLTQAQGFSGGSAVGAVDVEGSRDSNRMGLHEAATKLLSEGRAPDYGAALILAERELGA